MKKVLIGLLVGALLTSSVAYGASVIEKAAHNDYKLSVDGKDISLSKPMLSLVEQGSSEAQPFVPARSVLEGIGYEVSWDAEQKMLVAVKAPEADETGSQYKYYAEFPELLDFGWYAGLTDTMELKGRSSEPSGKSPEKEQYYTYSTYKTAYEAEADFNALVSSYADILKEHGFVELIPPFDDVKSMHFVKGNYRVYVMMDIQRELLLFL